MEHNDIPEQLEEKIDTDHGFPLECSCGSTNLKLINTEKHLKNFLENYLIPLRCVECNSFLCVNLLSFYVYE